MLAGGFEPKELAKQFVRSVMGAKYKPVAKKVLPVAMFDPNAAVPVYEPIEIGDLAALPIVPPIFENLEYIGRLTKEKMARIISCMPTGCLSRPELSLWAFI